MCQSDETKRKPSWNRIIHITSLIPGTSRYTYKDIMAISEIGFIETRKFSRNTKQTLFFLLENWVGRAMGNTEYI